MFIVPRLMKPMARILVFLACLVLMTCSFITSGCATSRQLRREQPASEILLDPLHIGIKADGELGLVDFDAATLFREGLRLHQTGNCERALVFYSRIIDEFKSSRYVSAATFNAGRCLESVGKTEKAVVAYGMITDSMPRSRDWINAAFRESMCLARLDRHAKAADLLSRILERDKLTVSDRIDALVLHGEAKTMLGELVEAERSLRTALRIFRKNEREEYLDPAPAARAEFRLAELAERRFLAARLSLPEDRMKADLEVKASRLLETQAGYLRTIRYGDPDWASAAGYRIGKLYLALHEAMQQAPVPEDLSAEEVEVYRDMLKKRTAVLLRKALRVFEMTLDLAERTRSDNHWTRSAREEMDKVKSRVLSLYEPLPEEGS